MQRWGVTSAGKTRFRCAIPKRSATRRRTDNVERAYHAAFADWLLLGLSQSLVARRHGITPQALRQRFRTCWGFAPLPISTTTAVQGIILDGTGVYKRERVVLVVEDAARHRALSWTLAPRESYPSWLRLLQALRGAGLNPYFAVCGGQKGLLKALREVWPEMLIQRCRQHVVRQAKTQLTQHPKTAAGGHLLRLVR